MDWSAAVESRPYPLPPSSRILGSDLLMSAASGDNCGTVGSTTEVGSIYTTKALLPDSLKT